MRFSIVGTPPTLAEIKAARAAIEKRQRRLHLFYIFSLYLIPIVTVVGCLVLQVHHSTGETGMFVMSGVVMLAIAAAGHAFHFQGYATAMNGMIIVGLSIYAIPAALIMVPAGIILQYKPKAWSREMSDLLQISDERNRNATEMKLVSATIGAYCKKVAACKRPYLVRAEYNMMVEQREREIRENNERSKVHFGKPEGETTKE
ncbi:MAG: hypothetical protein Q9M13_02365 [Mariprofundales bacterium]|nr:hypothetical protein [Mariprofundales bacterium]